MPAIILSDNGATSGSAGLKTSGGNDGVLLLQTTTSGGTPTTAISISNTQVVTYTNQPTYTGGTANGVLYLNGSKAVTSGTALVFDGTNLGVGTTSNDLSGSGVTTKISANNATGYAATNVNTGTAAYSVYQLGNNSTANRAGFALFGSSYTSAGLYRQDGVYLYAGGAGGVTLASEQAQPIYFATSNTERMRLDSSGNLMVGQTSATGKLSITGTGSSNTGILAINATDTSSSFVWSSQSFISGMTTGQTNLHMVGKAGSTKNAAWFGYKHSSDGSSNNILSMGLYGVDYILNVNGVGNVSLYGATTTADGVGITFPASQSASTNANCLDDYEEGTWTPVITGSGGGTLLYNYISGVYRKIGSMVYIQFGVNVASRSGGSGEILIDGLPFTSIVRGGYQEPANALQSGAWATPSYAGTIYMFVMNSTTQMRTRVQNNADTVGDFTSIQAGTYMNGIMVYCAA